MALESTIPDGHWPLASLDYLRLKPTQPKLKLGLGTRDELGNILSIQQRKVTKRYVRGKHGKLKYLNKSYLSIQKTILERTKVEKLCGFRFISSSNIFSSLNYLSNVSKVGLYSTLELVCEGHMFSKFANWKT